MAAAAVEIATTLLAVAAAVVRSRRVRCPLCLVTLLLSRSVLVALVEHPAQTVHQVAAQALARSQQHQVARGNMSALVALQEVGTLVAIALHRTVAAVVVTLLPLLVTIQVQVALAAMQPLPEAHTAAVAVAAHT
jgi:hypothetical protein